MKARTIPVVILLLFTVSQLFSQGPPPMREHRMRLLDELKLTDEQKKKFEKLRFDLEKQMIAQRSKIATVRLDYRQLLRAENPDKAALEKKLNEVSQLSNQTRTLRLNQWFGVNRLLNADQQKVWKKTLTMLADKGNRMGMHRGMRPRFERHMGPMRERGMMRREM